MANIKSAKKRVIVNRTKAERNKAKENAFMPKDDIELPKLDEKKEEKDEPIIEVKEEPQIKKDIMVSENPKINVDKDSKVIADNVISDDEFFDDFFGED